MQSHLMAVKTFHEKMQVSPTKRIKKKQLPILTSAALAVANEAKVLEDFGKYDERFNRIHLIFEEAAELALALAESDEIKALDGLTDLLYVVLGTAIAFDWPLVEAFAEVHRSNMTKENSSGNHRVRDKGNSYSPPDLKSILEEYRHGSK